jgi:hypothetical protein
MKPIVAGFVGIERELHRDLVSAPSQTSHIGSMKPQSTLRFLIAIAGYVPDK